MYSREVKGQNWVKIESKLVHVVVECPVWEKENQKIKFETHKALKKDHVDSECGFALAHVICRPIWPECESGNLTFFSIRSKSSNRSARFV